MAAIVHSDPYGVFLRKVGYSAGLEKTAERVEELTAQYLLDRDLTLASWNELVTVKWGRDKSAEKHFGDFFCALRLVQRTSGDVLVLENLDAMAICTELLEDEEQRRIAREFLLLWAILVNDGEIFVNLLLAGFEEQQIKVKLSSMMLRKRAQLMNYLGGKAPVQRINRIITIERQEKNKGSAGVGQSVASLRRTEPLQPERTAVLAPNDSEEIEFSGDYFRKVPPRRRDWANSLGLWDDKKGITERGRNFLEALRMAGYIDEQECFTYWPMDFELVRSGFRSDLFGDNTKNLWTCAVEFGSAYAGLREAQNAGGDANEAVDLIGKMMTVFRSLHARKSMLRRELPITVAYPAAVALACAQTRLVSNLPAAISYEQKGERRRVALRQSRNTGGALSVKR